MEKTIKAGVAAVGLLAAVNANAIPVVFTDTFSGITPEVLNSSPFVFTLPKFNSALYSLPGQTAVLDSVLVEITTDMNTNGTVRNTSGSTVNNATVQLGATVYGNGNSLGVTFDWDGVFNGMDLTHGELYVTWADNETKAFGPGTDAASDSWITGAQKNLFLGTGDWTHSVKGDGLSQSTVITNFDQNVTTTVDGELKVTYNYSFQEVPVPGPLALLGVGMLGLGIARRKMKK